MRLKSWAVQNSGLKINDTAETRLISALYECGISMHNFGCIPFTNEITGWQDLPDEEMFVHCSTKVLRILNDFEIPSEEIFVGATEAEAAKLRRNLTAGLFYDRAKFDLETQLMYASVRELMLNGDGEILKLRDANDRSFPVPMFVKPTEDLKLFQGTVLEPGETLLQWADTNTVDQRFYTELSSSVVVAPPKNILAEWRFFVVDGKVVTYSQYRWRGVTSYNEHLPSWMHSICAELATVYQPARAFVMDLCLLDTLEVKIVEYNCLNCSGLYHADIQNLAYEIEAIR